MSSTEEKLRAFYLAEIAPLQGQIELSLDGRAPESGSFYLGRSEGEAMQTAFGEGLTDPAAVGAALDARWAGTSLAGMGAKLVALAGEIETPEETAEVSDLIYEMF